MHFPVEAKWREHSGAGKVAATKRTPRPRGQAFCLFTSFSHSCPMSLMRRVPPPASDASPPASAASKPLPASRAGSRSWRGSSFADRAPGCVRWRWTNFRSAPRIWCRFAGCVRWFVARVRRNAASRRPRITGRARPPASALRARAKRSPRIPGLPPRLEVGVQPAAGTGLRRVIMLTHAAHVSGMCAWQEFPCATIVGPEPVENCPGASCGKYGPHCHDRSRPPAFLRSSRRLAAGAPRSGSPPRG